MDDDLAARLATYGYGSTAEMRADAERKNAAYMEQRRQHREFITAIYGRFAAGHSDGSTRLHLDAARDLRPKPALLMEDWKP